MTRRDLLPLAGGAPTSERVDAARNRAKILGAAQQLTERQGIEAVTIEDVARAAGVGVGTVYRRFRDRAGLLQALLDDRETALQRAFLEGPPPLGPGAPPAERIRAFLRALVDRVGEQRELLLAIDAGMPPRGLPAPHAVHHTHLAMLVRQLRPDADAAFLATALLAAVNARSIERYRGISGGTLDDVKAGLDQLLAGLAPPPAAPAAGRSAAPPPTPPTPGEPTRDQPTPGAQAPDAP